jgi:hypothetical protein
LKTVLERIAYALNLSAGCFEDLENARIVTTADFIEHVHRVYRDHPAQSPRQFEADCAYTIYRDLFDESPNEDRAVLYGAWFAARAVARLLIDEHAAEQRKGGAA